MVRSNAARMSYSRARTRCSLVGKWVSRVGTEMPTASATPPSVVCSYPFLTNSRVEVSMISARVSSRRRAREVGIAVLTSAPGQALASERERAAGHHRGQRAAEAGDVEERHVDQEAIAP